MMDFQEVQLRHVCREGNRCADMLASLAQGCAHGMTKLDIAPPELEPMLDADSRGFQILRL